MKNYIGPRAKLMDPSINIRKMKFMAYIYICFSQTLTKILPRFHLHGKSYEKTM